MTSKPVPLLLADLGVTTTDSRPHVSTTIPFSESQFRTKVSAGVPGPLRVHPGQSCFLRKTSCGNARKCSMLLIDFTRSASSAAHPNHRLFPAKAGLTSRFPLRKRCLWENADEPQQSTFEKAKCT
jgi:hypothetical protein